MANDQFWTIVNTQLDELTTATTAEDAVRILSPQRCPLDIEVIDAAAVGFFAGSGGDRTVAESLTTAGWTRVWAEASYYWVMRAPDGSLLTYIEGDIYLGDRSPAHS